MLGLGDTYDRINRMLSRGTNDARTNAKQVNTVTTLKDENHILIYGM